MAPQYTTRDLYYYGGLFAGIIVAFGVLGLVGVQSQWIKLIVGLVFGVGLGWVTEKLLTGEDKG